VITIDATGESKQKGTLIQGVFLSL